MYQRSIGSDFGESFVELERQFRFRAKKREKTFETRDNFDVRDNFDIRDELYFFGVIRFEPVRIFFKRIYYKNYFLGTC